MRGEICKGYKVWGKLSQGGMSDVWLARHTELAIPVILKTLLPAGATAENFESRYARLLSEARLTARLTSPRVVRIIDVGVHTPAASELESLPFLVEEYVDGIDLAEFDRRRRNALRRRLPLWTVADLVAQAAEGLHAAHQAGVIHCDVKPSNLFGHGHAEVKVGDFGVAVASAARSAAPAGTPLFMAPEQMLGEPITRSADMYALGATACMLRYGQPPFETPVAGIREDASPRFPAAATAEEAYFQHVLARMMARRPEARYANMMIPRHHLRTLARSITPPLRLTRDGEHAFEVGAVRVTFEVGDLAKLETDAVVNSASSAMTMRNSLGGALRAAGGVEIEEEAMAGGEQPLGECIATRAGTLSCRGVLHAVGGWNEVSCVSRATHRALLLAEELKFARIAMPAIATGSTGVTMEACADAMTGVLRFHLALGGSQLREVRFVLSNEKALRRFGEVGAAMLLGSDDRLGLDDGTDAPASGPEVTGPTMFVTPPRTRTATEEI